jgi:hypothetical protein
VSDGNFDAREMFGMERPKDKFLGFNNDGSENWLFGNQEKGVISPTGVI